MRKCRNPSLRIPTPPRPPQVAPTLSNKSASGGTGNQAAHMMARHTHPAWHLTRMLVHSLPRRQGGPIHSGRKNRRTHTSRREGRSNRPMRQDRSLERTTRHGWGTARSEAC
jgi:hypothetical protein